MMGMEAMLASMLGVKPDELKAKMTGLIDVANTAGDRLANIERQLEAIEACQAEIMVKLERQTDV